MKDIIITSNEVWGPIWFSKQHYANELSEMGCRVFFINPPTKWNASNLFSPSFILRKEKEQLWSVSYQNRLPIRFFPSLMLWLNDLINSRLLEKKLLLSEEVIWWQFDPFRFVQVSIKRKLKRIYHVTDEFMMHKTDLPIAKRSDLIIGTSKPHFEYYLKHFPNKTIHIPHGVSDDQITRFDKQELLPKALLIGTMNEDYDLDLLMELANAYPKMILEVIGPLNFESEDQKQKFQQLEEVKNVSYLGPIDHNKLISYIKSAAVCISVYQFDIKRVLSSLKILNYLAAGKPVVTTVLQGFEYFEGKGVFFASNREDFILKVGQVFEGELQVDFSELEVFLSSRSYPKLIKTILDDAHL